eukprot:Seg1507.4 transcript_id=Seg1507.4/GoldUCD/mRNA.D3Y31 product="hypothetical protein" protein_id=Seg1507.4/GoldUCD/D3Y31
MMQNHRNPEQSGRTKHAQRKGGVACLLLYSKAYEMAAESPKANYDDFKLQFDNNYGTAMINGHKEWIERKLVPEIQAKFQKSDSYSILAVGSGTGYPDVALLNALASFAKKSTRITYAVAEPDPLAVAVCKANLEKASTSLNIEFKFEVVPSEQFLLGLKGKFDLIHFVHVISWLKDPERILKKCYEELLADNGVMAVVDFDKEYMEQEMEGGGHHGDTDNKGTEGAEENGGLMYVEVDLIAKKHKWSCSKFKNNIKTDVSNVATGNAGKEELKTWLFEDPDQMSAQELKEKIEKFASGVEKEETDGALRYYFYLREMIYFLTK